MTSAEERLKKGNAHFEQGETYFSQLRFEEAEKEYKKALIEYDIALNDDLTFNRARYGAGFAHTRLGNFETAINFLKKALKRDPDSYDRIKAWHMLGIAYREKYLHISAKEKDRIEAFEYFQKALDFDTENIELWKNIGYTHGVSGEFTKALECYQKILELSPTYLFAWHNMAYTYKVLGEYTKALECYQKTIELNPGYEMAWLGVGDVYKHLSEYDKALESYQKAIVIDPRLEDTLRKKLNKLSEIKQLCDKGKGFFKQGNTKQGLEQYRKALELDKFRGRLELGSVYLKLKNYKRAKFHFEEVLVIAPKYIPALYRLGFAHYMLGKHKKALKYLQQAVEINPRFQKAWKLMEEIYESLGNSDKADECNKNAELSF